jgi:hypothetical protein
MSALGPGCVKTREKSSHKKNDLSEQPLRDFLKVGKGHPTHENFNFLRFYTAWAVSGRPAIKKQAINHEKQATSAGCPERVVLCG